MRDTFDYLARLELLDGWVPSGAQERKRMYDEIAPLADSPIEQAYLAFDYLSGHATGLAASVFDQRLAQMEIIKNVETYAALGGLSVSEILDLQGWWSPNWAWSQALNSLSPTPPPLDDLTAVAEELAPLLLRAGAEHLAGFYSRITAGAGRLLRLRYRLVTPRSIDRATVAFTIAVLETRRRLFLSGPREDGHYLQRENADDTSARRALQDLQLVAGRLRHHPFRRRFSTLI